MCIVKCIYTQNLALTGKELLRREFVDGAANMAKEEKWNFRKNPTNACWKTIKDTLHSHTHCYTMSALHYNVGQAVNICIGVVVVWPLIYSFKDFIVCDMLLLASYTWEWIKSTTKSHTFIDCFDDIYKYIYDALHGWRLTRTIYTPFGCGDRAIDTPTRSKPICARNVSPAYLVRRVYDFCVHCVCVLFSITLSQSVKRAIAAVFA